MTKADLIARVAKKTKISQAMANRVIDATLGEIRTLLGKGGSISFTGFGSFSVTKRAKRKGRNPQTGEEIQLEARRVLTFKPSLVLKNALNQ